MKCMVELGTRGSPPRPLLKMKRNMSDLSDDDIDLDDEEDLAPDLLEQVQRLQAHIDRREHDHIVHSRGRRRQIEEWMDERALRRRVDYLDAWTRDDRHRERLGR